MSEKDITLDELRKQFDRIYLSNARNADKKLALKARTAAA
jgi:hypothetical protein